MAYLSAPRLLIGGTFSGVGKSFFTLGLVVALRRRGLSVSCCVTGQALQQASILHRISRRYTRVLDRRMLKPEEVLTALAQAGMGADIILIDGKGGLYDGIGPGDARGSDAEIAIMSRTPVVLLTDVAPFSNSMAALVKGYSQFTSEAVVFALAGNFMEGFDSQDPLLPNPVLDYVNEALSTYRLPTYVGGLPQRAMMSPLPPGGVFQEMNYTALPVQFLQDLGSLVINHVDIDRLLEIANAAPQIEFDSVFPDPLRRRCRIAVTDDSCFGLCYQDNLDLLRYYGAELVSFSPLLDMKLPDDIGGLYVTGAYLKSYGEELASNAHMRNAILEFADAGGVVYSEGAGTAYLCRSYQLEQGEPYYPGAGLIHADIAPIRSGAAFLDATTIEDSVLGMRGLTVQGFSTGEWGLSGFSAGHAGSMLHTLKIQMDGLIPFTEGFSTYSQVCSTFNFLHFSSQPRMAKALVEAAVVASKG
jgi:cobyrinic acid a,c-diamide synthase